MEGIKKAVGLAFASAEAHISLSGFEDFYWLYEWEIQILLKVRYAIKLVITAWKFTHILLHMRTTEKSLIFPDCRSLNVLKMKLFVHKFC